MDCIDKDTNNNDIEPNRDDQRETKREDPREDVRENRREDVRENRREDVRENRREIKSQEININKEIDFSALESLRQSVKDSSQENIFNLINFLKDRNIYDLHWPNGETILFWAVTYNNLPLVKYLIEVRAMHINLSNYRGATPLYYACITPTDHINSAGIEVIQYLLHHHANPRIRSLMSGLFPIDNLSDAQREIKDLIMKYDDLTIPFTGYKGKIELKSSFNLYLAFRYRYYMYYVSNLNYYYSLYTKSWSSFNESSLSIIHIDEQCKMIYNNSGFLALVEHCNGILRDYHNLLINNKDKNINIERCLCCGSDKILNKCSKCKSVYFCNQFCQKAIWKLHQPDCREN